MEGETLSAVRINPQKITENKIVVLLPNQSTKYPATGRPIIEPIGRISNSTPNSASLKAYKFLRNGSLDAQLEKHNPLKKNAALTASLCLMVTFIMMDDYFLFIKRTTRYTPP